MVVLVPETKEVRHPEPGEELMTPWTGFYVENLSEDYTVYVTWDENANEDKFPLAPGAWRDFNFMVDEFVSIYCADEAEVLVIG